MAAASVPKGGAFGRLLNLGMLVGGFGLGQGSIFLAQTYLVAKNDSALLALFGTHFSFAMLAIIMVEAGSLTVMARQVAKTAFLHEGRSDVWRAYWEITLFRLTMAALVLSAALASLFLFDLAPFSRNYLLYALPGILIWAFNAAGFLDGLQKSGIGGLTGSIAYLASAIALVLASGQTPEMAGMMTGLALTIGYLATVAIQLAALAVAGWRPCLVRPSASGIRQAFIEEGSMLAGLMPGQLYFRVQLAIANAFLGTEATALLVYAKQIVGAASQVAGFARRVEFPRLVAAVMETPHLSVRAMLLIQKASFAIAIVLFAGIALGGVLAGNVLDGFARNAWVFLGFFAITIVSEAIGQALVQGLFARGLYHFAAIARITAVSVAVLLAYGMVMLLGINSFILADLVSHAIVISLSLIWLRRHVHVGSAN
ncbi:hypothetical protein [Rhizobium alvei]|uniref:Membrane protein involved in the export of O-antigen and teichoic acid n=1 Tax=Rhizobium alvei TaxID=1132659 RepID=A0ABT8YKZ1_9HYPH|nr:hypothetical protein [Rhizobium alvei]MDO6963969.1 hypothetical protein [Rhizobium alvei]